MKKYLLVIASMLFVALKINAQGTIALTEVNPITNDRTDAKFFELFYYNNVTSTIQDQYFFVSYTRDANNNPRLFVGKMNFDSKFYASSTLSPTPNGFTNGSLVCAEDETSDKFKNLPKPTGLIQWTNLFSSGTASPTWKVYSYDFNANGGTWTIVNSTLDPFENYASNHKIAVMLFKKSSTSSTNKLTLVDVVADFLTTGQEISTLKSLDLDPDYFINFQSDVKIGYNKYVNQALGTNNPYQYKKQNRGNLPICDLVWVKESVETPGYVDGISKNNARWSVEYYLPKTISWGELKGYSNPLVPALTQSLQTSGAIQGASPYFLRINDFEYQLRIILSFSNFNNLPDHPDFYKNLVVSFYVDENLQSGELGSYEKQGSGVNFVYNDPYLHDRQSSQNDLGPFDIEATNRGLLLGTYSVSSTGEAPIWIFDESNKIYLVEFKVSIPTSFLSKNIHILTGYKITAGVDPSTDFCYGTEKILKIPSALPALFKTSAVKIVDGKAHYTWTTASEQNNKGFEVQRSVGNANDFKTIGFVGTRAKDGNSQTEINYSFDDADLKAGVVHYYRLNQIDFDGKAMLTPIKSIKPGSIETDLSVYPNPNQGSFLVNASKLSGKVSIFLIDNTGRVLNHFNNVAESTTRISNLKAGFYTLKIVNTETGEQSAQRIVVQ